MNSHALLLEVLALVFTTHGVGGVHDAVREGGAICEGCVWPNKRVGDGDVFADFTIWTDPRVCDGGARGDLSGLVNLRDGLAGFERGTDAVGFEVGIACTEVEPMALVGIESSELPLSGEFQKGRDDGDFFVGRDEVEDLRANAVDASELMRAFGDCELVADINDEVILHG